MDEQGQGYSWRGFKVSLHFFKRTWLYSWLPFLSCALTDCLRRASLLNKEYERIAKEEKFENFDLVSLAQSCQLHSSFVCSSDISRSSSCPPWSTLWTLPYLEASDLLTHLTLSMVCGLSVGYLSFQLFSLYLHVWWIWPFRFPPLSAPQLNFWRMDVGSSHGRTPRVARP